jgi:hypothetical protein
LSLSDSDGADSSLLWNPSFTEFAHPAISTDSTVGRVGPAFLLAAAMFGFVIQISNLVLEKEMRLRQVRDKVVLLFLFALDILKTNFPSCA